MSSNSTIHQEISLSIKTTETTQDDYIFNNSHSNFRNKNMDFISKKREKLFIYTTPVIKRKKELLCHLLLAKQKSNLILTNI